ncbi:hypothetical protein [Secundilactobacillus oryzae]|uniref:hypothetical protein n=1 Tax=Secundilactobacillus oryzae TaxID=1202668 RepID=UPI0006CFE953|nr:hypothetical protein [Secundilactobacillus oryzae]
MPLLSDKKGGDAVMVWAVGIGFVGGSLLFAIPGLNVLAVTIIAIFVGIASGIAFNLSIVYFAQKNGQFSGNGRGLGDGTNGGVSTCCFWANCFRLY